MNAGEAHDGLCAQLRWVSAADRLTARFTSQTLWARPALNMPSLRKPEYISVSNFILPFLELLCSRALYLRRERQSFTAQNG